MEANRHKRLGLGSAEDIEAFDIELLEASDRAAAVLGQALLEQLIKQTIWNWLKCSDAHKRKLIGDEESAGALGFSDQCRLARGMGLVSEKALSDLLIIGRIRNRFGHSTKPLTFETRQIKDRCDALKELSDPPVKGFFTPADCSPGRMAFMRSVLGLYFHILDRATKKYERGSRYHRRRVKYWNRKAEKERLRSAHYKRRAKLAVDMAEDLRLNPMPRDLKVRYREALQEGGLLAEDQSTPPATP